MGRDDGRSVTAEEWNELWADSDKEEEGECYVLPKMYPGPRIRCPNCGCWQGNEAVLDTYRWCMRCCTVLQDPSSLYWDTPLGLGPFRVIAASYGHPRDPKLACDVRPQLQTRVGVKDRLEIDRREDLTTWLGNPCPGTLKALRIRYVSLEGVAKGQRREVWLRESEEGHLADSVSLRVSTSLPLVILFKAEYGSPGGSSRGRGTFDVTEFMQGRIDLAGGRYLFLPKTERLTDLFGDPCPGREKCLLLHYEILGTEGKVEALESDNRLLSPVSISSTPMLAPLIIVESATYGQTQEGIDERLQTLHKVLSELLSLQNRKDIGMPLTREDNKRLVRLRPLIAELEYLKGVSPSHFDVTARLQRRVEELGGGVLELVAESEDLNRLFGNPLPGKKKELRVRYLVVGHDSERLTSLEESTTSGYPRNFILQRTGQVSVQVTEDRMGRGLLETDVLVDSPKVLSVIEILNSSYGHPRNASKTYDISTKLRSIIDTQGGEKLVINCQTDLLKLFDEPCRGVRKKIKIAYVARGLNGHIRVNERDQRLVADIIVGYYSRDGFKDGTLFAKRHVTVHLPGAALATASARILTADDAREDREIGNPVTCDGDDPEHAEMLPLLTLKVDGGESDKEGGGLKSAPLADLRRRRRQDEQSAHQDAVRRKLEERESERRRLQVERERRARDVARAVADAEAAERARLLKEAEDAANATPLVARLLHTLQSKAKTAVAAVAASAARTGTARPGTPVGGAGRATMVPESIAAGDTAADETFDQAIREQQIILPPEQAARNSISYELLPSAIPSGDVNLRSGRGNELGAGLKRKGSGTGRQGDNAVARKTKANDCQDSSERGAGSNSRARSSPTTSAATDPKATMSSRKGNQKKLIAKGGKISNASQPAVPPPLARAKTDAAATAIAIAAIAEDEREHKPTPELEGTVPLPFSKQKHSSPSHSYSSPRSVPSQREHPESALSPGREEEAGTRLSDGETRINEINEHRRSLQSTVEAEKIAPGENRPRRRPSVERAKEPRAVFVHRASLSVASVGVEMNVPSSVGGGDAGQGGMTFSRRPSKGGVGSVLPL